MRLSRSRGGATKPAQHRRAEAPRRRTRGLPKGAAHECEGQKLNRARRGQPIMVGGFCFETFPVACVCLSFLVSLTRRLPGAIYFGKTCAARTDGGACARHSAAASRLHEAHGAGVQLGNSNTALRVLCFSVGCRNEASVEHVAFVLALAGVGERKTACGQPARVPYGGSHMQTPEGKTVQEQTSLDRLNEGTGTSGRGARRWGRTARRCLSVPSRHCRYCPCGLESSGGRKRPARGFLSFANILAGVETLPRGERLTAS